MSSFPGNYVELHSDRRRGLDVEDVGKEAMIHWNGPKVNKSDHIGKRALDRHFKGSTWHFVTRLNKSDSTVIKRLKQEKVRINW